MKTVCGFDDPPTVSRKKFHVPQRASQGKRGTKGDHVHCLTDL